MRIMNCARKRKPKRKTPLHSFTRERLEPRKAVDTEEFRTKTKTKTKNSFTLFSAPREIVKQRET